jgi:dethiobiotin synthase
LEISHALNDQSAAAAIFVTGTDTDVGKTIICALLCRALQAGYWKPIQSGTLDSSDTMLVNRLTDFPASHFYPETYRLTEPLSPHASAALDNVHIELGAFSLPSYSQSTLIVEGAGGVMVPINEQHFVADIITHLNLPTLVVARSALGTINHTLLTLQALRARGVHVLGVILNGPANPGNVAAIEKYGDIKVVAQVQPLDLTVSGITLAAEQLRHELSKHLPHLAPVHSNENGRVAVTS